jgi:hypothetical protein
MSETSRLDVANQTFRIYQYLDTSSGDKPQVIFVSERDNVEIKFTPKEFRIFASWIKSEAEV